MKARSIITLLFLSLLTILPASPAAVPTLPDDVTDVADAAYTANETYPSGTLRHSVYLTTTGNTISIPVDTWLGKGVSYCRIFVVKAADLTPLYDLTSALSIPVGMDATRRGLFCTTDYGFVEFPRYNATITPKPINLTLPDGMTWDDIAVMAVKKAVASTGKDNEDAAAAAVGITGTLPYTNFAPTSDPTTWDEALVYFVNRPYSANEQYPATASCLVQNITATGTTAELPLAGFLGASAQAFSRTFVMDAATLKPLYELTDALSVPSGINATQQAIFQRTGYGIVEFPRLTATRNTLPLTFTLPEGKEWTDFFVMTVKKTVGGGSKDAETVNAANLGINGEFDYRYFSVISDPTTWESAIIYTFNHQPRNTFQPYQGVAGKADEWGVSTVTGARRQRSHSWSYDVYVAPGSTTQLKAPVASGTWIEYANYWRWYDDNTFKANPRITTSATAGAGLQELFTDEQGRSEGLFWASDATTQDAGLNTTFANWASVLYTAPADDAWTGDDIAADASRWTDGEGYGCNVLTAQTFREPTLSIRYKWHIRPNTVIASAIKQAIMGGNAYEDHGNLTIALADEQSTAYSTLRLDLASVGYYWFYPYRSVTWGNLPTENDFNSQMQQAKSVSWAVHLRDGDKMYYRYLGTDATAKFQQSIRHDLYASDVAGTYTNVDDPTDTRTFALETGREYTVIAYANSQTYSSASNLTSPIARFNCYFITQVEPLTADAVSSHRAVERLEANYTRVGLINFDDEQGMNFTAPAQPYTEGSPANNSWNRHLDWDKAYYGFVYPQLVAAGKSGFGYKGFGRYGAFHGDYLILKQAGGGDKSASPTGGGLKYMWWYGTSPVLRDRTYHLTGGARSGHFLYVDASDEARPIASLDFEANLCSGSTLILSAAVANLTSGGAEAPQLVFKLYGVKTDDQGRITERHLVQSFASGSFASHAANGKAVWYQVFARTFIHPNAAAEAYSHFTVTIDNNCRTTSGADYAIDDIRFYVANDQVEVLQQADRDDLCDVKDNGAYLKLRMDYSMMRTFLKAGERRKPFFYRICTSDGKPVPDVAYPVGDIHEQRTDANGLPYGVVWVSNVDAENTPHVEKDIYGFSHFILANEFFRLDPTKEYYISGALPQESFQTDGTYTYAPAFWGNPGTPCSVYSKILNVRQQDFVVTSGNGQTVSKFYADCGESSVDVTLTAKLSIPDAVFGGRKYIDWKFDWVVGGDTPFQESVNDGVMEALKHFRTEYPEAPSGDFWDFDITPAKGVYTDMDQLNLMFALLSSSDSWSDDVLLYFLEGSNSMTHTIYIPEGTIRTNIWYIPVPGTYTDTETGITYRICPDPIKGRIELSHRSPELKLGFPTVTYPDELDRSARYVRLGLKQANELKDGKLLRIPLSDYRDINLNDASAEGVTRNNLVFAEDNGENKSLYCAVRLVSTNDPSVPQSCIATPPGSGQGNRYFGGKAAEVLEADSLVTPETQSFAIDFSKHTESISYTDADGLTNVVVHDTDIPFHEGYDYQFVLTYHDTSQPIGTDKDGQTLSAPCFGHTFFTLRIIPEYVTWTGAVPSNTNWNNDLNWRRASRSELNLPYVADLTAETEGANAIGTGGMPSNSLLASTYAEYGSKEEPALQQSPGTDPSTTPQAFVPMRFTKVVINPGTSFPYLGSYEVDSRQGIITNLQNPNLSEGTALIAYDLMVETEPGADGTYQCERFYANTCNEVYFRTDRTDLPQGEGQLRNQHYLDYRRAWVDINLKADKWNLFATPLHGVCAGDFYLPKATGIQNTEAFEPITFNTDLYGRDAYTVFQRNWLNGVNRVIRSGTEWYEATVDYDDREADNDPDATAIPTVLQEWSHAYNDMTVPYLPGRGVSVLPKRPQGSTADATSALFRLPKADTEYRYYDHLGNASATTATPDRTLEGLLSTSLTTADDPRRLNGNFNVQLTSADTRLGYYLIGNPYMGTLQMSRFFDDNPSLYRKYWTIDDGQITAHGGTDDQLGTLAPMHAFFVKSKAGSNVTEVAFQAAQCTSVFYATGQSISPERPIALTATLPDGRTATALVVADPQASDAFSETEDVETLFDSNLRASAPQLFTVAGQQAAAINRLADLRNVPLAVSTPADTDVRFSVSGAEALREPLYLYDAEAGTSRQLTAADTLTIRSNQLGRYFLCSRAMQPASAVSTALRCWPTGEKGGVVASTEPTDRLTLIQAFDSLGRLHTELHPSDPVARFTLPAGVWLVTVASEAVPEGRTFKLIVK